MELRQHKRYRLSALVNFEWDSNGAVHRGEGQTRDISPAGVFVVTNHAPAVGTAVRLDVDLPGLQAESTGPRLKTHAHVVRTERTGFAAIADQGFRLQLQNSDSSRKSGKKHELLQMPAEVLQH